MVGVRGYDALHFRSRVVYNICDGELSIVGSDDAASEDASSASLVRISLSVCSQVNIFG